MRTLILVVALAAAMPLAACGQRPNNLPAAPASKLHIAEVAYQDATFALETAIAVGTLNGPAGATAAKADSVAYTALQVARSLFAALGQTDSLAANNDDAHERVQAELAAAASR